MMKRSAVNVKGGLVAASYRGLKASTFRFFLRRHMYKFPKLFLQWMDGWMDCGVSSRDPMLEKF